MAGNPSDHLRGQVHRLFQLGAVGMMSDAQLLDRFLSRRDEAAEAAFEELVIRHGPIVLRVCRSVLRDAHDAEDAFQAVFLVLASRAGSIRRSGSVASWLFGVAHRVATRARRSAARRHRRDQLVAERTPESEAPSEDDPGREILHEELDGLPERLRAPVVLCYLQGLTYAAAAHQLGVSEVAVRGRLARARERLRHRLTRRGVAVPAGLLVAGAAGQAQAAVPVLLIQGTIRIALGFVAGHTAAVLARGVLNSMLFNQMKVAVVCLLIGIGGNYWAWHAFAGAAGEETGQVAGKAPASKPRPTQPVVAYRLTGSVRVEGTGEPVQGGQFTVMLGDVTGTRDPDRNRMVTSGKDGQFLVNLPPGQARAWIFQAPAGYWAPGNMKSQETFVLSRSQPVHRKDYVVRRGTVWPFLLIGADGKPTRGFVNASTNNAFFMSEADEDGRASLTLPTEAGKVMVGAMMGKPESPSFASRSAIVSLEWSAGFRPDAAKTIERIPGGYSLKDEAGRTATIPNHVERSGGAIPTLLDAKLVIRVLFSEAGRVRTGSLSGRVVNEAGRPIEGVRVSPAFHIQEGGRGGGVFPDDKEHEAITDRDGRFLIRAIPRDQGNGKPTSLSLVVRKDRFATLQTSIFPFRPGRGEVPQVLDPIRLEPGVSLSGRVLDPDGRPVDGAWVTPSGGFAMRSLFTRTDAAGKFTVRNLPRGLVELGFEYGSLWGSGKYLADGTDDGLKVQLRPSAEFTARPAAPPAPEPPALGRPAPPLQVAGWTDGKPRTLADYRGKVVFLDFWGIWCGPCVNGLPSLERLKQKYEPRGVVFLSIHTPGDEIAKIRRFLDFKKATMVSALDEGHGKADNSRNGVTADRYGVRGYPTLAMIDRKGNVAFHSGIGTREGVAAMKALGKQMGLDESTMTEADFHRLWEAFFSREVEKVLGSESQQSGNP